MILKEMEDFASVNNIPIIRPKSRQILIDLIKEKQPKKILEIGTAIGFSGSLILNNCDGDLTTIELSQDMINLATNNFTKQNLNKRVNIISGDATEIVKSINEKFDFIFLDGPKSHYQKQLPYLIELLNIGGVFLADNVLFMGQVLNGEYPKHKHRTCILSLRKFLADIENDTRLKSQLIDIEDGLISAVRIS